MRTPVTVGVVGLGPRGAAVARAFDELPTVELRWLCDESREARRRLARRHPAVATTPAVEDLIGDETLDAIVVATPSPTHATVAAQALDAQKHVLVEQPLALSAREAIGLIALAGRRNRCLMVANPLLFEPAIRKLKELIELGRLGDVYYVHAGAQTLARGAGEESVLWSLGVPVVHALLYLLDDEPVESVVRADAYASPGLVEVATAWFRFATGITAHAHLSWLDARESRRVVVVGSRRTAVFDDTVADRKLTVFEKPSPGRRLGGEDDRYGEILTPRLAAADPVRLECDSFVAEIRRAHDLAAPRRAAAAVAIVEELDRRGGAGDDVLPAPHQLAPRLELVQP